MRLRGDQLVACVPFPVTDAQDLIIACIRPVHALQRKTDLVGVPVRVDRLVQREFSLVQLNLVGMVGQEVAIIVTGLGACGIGHDPAFDLCA